MERGFPRIEADRSRFRDNVSCAEVKKQTVWQRDSSCCFDRENPLNPRNPRCFYFC